MSDDATRLPHRTTALRRSSPSSSPAARPWSGRPSPAGRSSPASRAAAGDRTRASTARSTTARSRKADELDLGPGMPRRSLKEFFLPPTEPLLAGSSAAATSSSRRRRRVPPRVVLGASPATPPPSRSSTGSWAGTTGRALVRPPRGHDDHLPGLPASRTSLLLPAWAWRPTRPGAPTSCSTPVDGGFLVEAVTAKGRAFLAANARALRRRRRPGAGDQGAAFRAAARERVARTRRSTPRASATGSSTHFEDPFWATLGLRCHGCGACAFVCPTCHCFDIVDEPEGVGRGTRRRNWDTCQTGKFTAPRLGPQPARRPERALPPARHPQVRHLPRASSARCCAPAAAAACAPARGQDIGEMLVAIDESRSDQAAATAVTGRRPRRP